jgi:hypothetical protein
LWGSTLFMSRYILLLYRLGGLNSHEYSFSRPIWRLLGMGIQRFISGYCIFIGNCRRSMRRPSLSISRSTISLVLHP